PADRLSPTKLAQVARRIGPDAEKGRMAHGWDPAVAEQEIERHREQAPDHDLAEQRKIGIRDEENRQQSRPEDDLAISPARHRTEIALACGRRRLRAGHTHVPRPMSPCGRHSMTTTVIA